MRLWDRIRWNVALYVMKRVGVPQAIRKIGAAEKPWGFQEWQYRSEEDLSFIEKVSWVFACTRVIAENCSKVGLNVKRVAKENLYENIFNHPFEMVLDSPNPFMDRFGLLEATFAPLKVAGRAFWYVNKNALGEVAQIWPLLPSKVFIVPDKRKLIKAFVYDTAGGKIPFSPSEIVMFKSWCPTSMYEGMGALRAAQHAVEQDVKAQDFGTAFFDNAAIPSGFLVTDQFLSQKQLDDIEARYQDKYGGTEKSHAMAILHGGLKYQQLMLDPERAMLIANRNFSAKEILTTFGVPPTEIGMVADVGRGTAEALHVVFLENVIEPLLTRVAGTITRGILQNKYYDNTYPNQRLVATFDDVIPVHTETRSRAAERNARATLTLVRSLGPDHGLAEAKRQGLVSQHAEMGVPLIFGGQEGLMLGRKEEGNIEKGDDVARGGAALKGIEEQLVWEDLTNLVSDLKEAVDNVD